MLHQIAVASEEVAAAGRNRSDAPAPEYTWWDTNEALAPQGVPGSEWLSVLLSGRCRCAGRCATRRRSPFRRPALHHGRERAPAAPGQVPAVPAPALRSRTPDDVPGLLVLLRRTHEQEGYPVREVAVSAWWLASEQELGGWVAEQDGVVRGHVALHPAGGDAALPLWQRATGRDPDGLAVVSRLFTDRAVAGTGVALLQHAVEQAAALGRAPVLQVDPDSPARTFYLRRGWTDAGSARQQWGHRTVDAVVMVRERS